MTDNMYNSGKIDLLGILPAKQQLIGTKGFDNNEVGNGGKAILH